MKIAISILAALSIAACATSGKHAVEGAIAIPNSGNFELPDLLLLETQAVSHQCDPTYAIEQGYDCVRVYYGTNRSPFIDKTQNRTPTVLSDAGWMFGSSADFDECEPAPDKFAPDPALLDVCHLGEISVAIPVTRKSGTVDILSPGQALSTQDLQKKLWIAQHAPYCDQEKLARDERYAEYCDWYKAIVTKDPISLFTKRIRQVLAQAENNSSGHAFVFIHGFNVPFRNAAVRAAQLKYDMDFDGPVMFYSWPSNGQTFAYMSDKIDADLSVDGLERFLRLANRSVSCDGISLTDPCNPNGNKVHIIAHSMGTRVTAQALARIAASDPELKFGHVFFAAGDLDATLFSKWVGSAAQKNPDIFDSLTLYTSEYDGAVSVSRWLSQLGGKIEGDSEDRERIGTFHGDTPFALNPALRFQTPVQTIDISSLAESTIWWLNPMAYAQDNHASYASSYQITDDMLQVMCSTSFINPEARGVGDPETLANGVVFWKAKEKSDLAREYVRAGCNTEFSLLRRD